MKKLLFKMAKMNFSLDSLGTLTKSTSFKKLNVLYILSYLDVILQQLKSSAEPKLTLVARKFSLTAYKQTIAKSNTIEWLVLRKSGCNLTQKLPALT